MREWRPKEKIINPEAELRGIHLIKYMKISKNSLSIKIFFAWGFALFLLITTMTVSSYADTLVPDHSTVDVCATSHSREKPSGNQSPASDKNHCFTHFNCHHQPSSLNVISLNNPGSKHRLMPVKNTFDLSLFITSIFHPPQIHIWFPPVSQGMNCPAAKLLGIKMPMTDKGVDNKARSRACCIWNQSWLKQE